jgi:hypothetical protein
MPLKTTQWHIQAHVHLDDETIEQAKHAQACFVLGTTIDTSELSDTEVLAADKGQSQVEGGFRFLKDPLFFVSSLFIKKPNRIEGLRMVMTLALLVYSVAQRRLRMQLAKHQYMQREILRHFSQARFVGYPHCELLKVSSKKMQSYPPCVQETVPNQINQPTTSPTLRWVFQLLEGIHRVRMTLQGQVHDLIEGLNDVQIKGGRKQRGILPIELVETFPGASRIADK